MYDEQCKSSLSTLKYHLHENMREDIQIFGMLSDLDSSPYEHLPMHMKQAFRRNLQLTRTRMMETVNVIEKSHDRALLYRKKKIEGNFGRSI